MGAGCVWKYLASILHEHEVRMSPPFLKGKEPMNEFQKGKEVIN